MAVPWFQGEDMVSFTEEEIMKKRIFAWVLAALTLVSLSGCQSNTSESQTAGQTGGAETESAAPASASADAKKIGVLQQVQHPALDRANEGFVAALKEAGIDYTIDQQNAGGEPSAAQTIASKLVNDKDDLIFTIGTTASQAVAGLTEDIPIVVCAVTDPAESGLVDSNEKPGKNVTGASDKTPIKEQIALLTKLLPEAKNVGILYCTAEPNSALQAKDAMEAIGEKGLTGAEYTVSNSNEIQSVVESMVGKVDVIYVPTDNVIAAGMSTVSMIATEEHKIPIIGAEVAHVENGALATYGIDYFELGKLAGQQAVAILEKGEKPAEMPIAYLDQAKCKLEINEEVAKQLGIDTTAVSVE